MNSLVKFSSKNESREGCVFTFFSVKECRFVPFLRHLLDSSRISLVSGLIGIWLILSTGVSAQNPGDIDPSFNIMDNHSKAGFNGSVESLIIQPDGKILAGGQFGRYYNVVCDKVARLHQDGSLDTNFHADLGGYGWVKTMALLPDGKILVGGYLKNVGIGPEILNIARLNVDGSLDTSFDPQHSFNNRINSILLRPDGKILVGGLYNSLAGGEASYFSVELLNADGSRDHSFTYGGPPYHLYEDRPPMALQADGKIIVGNIRLHVDGSLDTGFQAGIDFNEVSALAIQSDGKILIGGGFNINGSVHNKMIRLNTDGSSDNSFSSEPDFDGNVKVITLLPNGKFLVGGQFTRFNGITRNNVVQLNANGSLDNSFKPGEGFDWTVLSLSLQKDGKILAGGDFSSYNDIPRNGIARLNESGFLDNRFNPGTGFNDSPAILTLQTDGKILAGGAFSSFNNVPRNSIARLNADGSLDTSFDPGTGFDNRVLSIALQADGKILVGGWFSSFNGISRYGLARLNPNGSVDTGFNPGAELHLGYVYSFALQPDGKILVGGEFGFNIPNFGKCIARLNPDGSIDPSFQAGVGFDLSVFSIAVQSDGKILIGGDFTSYNGIPCSRIVRLHPDGSLDTGFNPGSGFNDQVKHIVLQADGKILVVGSFTKYNNTPGKYLVRLRTDGSLDTSFDIGNGFNDWVSAIALEPDGKMIVGGSFKTYNGVDRQNIARLHTDGSQDTSFNPGIGFGNISGSGVAALVLQPDNKIVVGGNFTSSKEAHVRTRIARLFAGGGSLWVDKLYLVDADKNTQSGELRDGSTINLFRAPNLSVQAKTAPNTVGSVRLELSRNGVLVKTQIENVAPYALNGDIQGDYMGFLFSEGSYTLTATPYTTTQAGGTAGKPLTVHFEVIDEAPSIYSFVLVNTDTDTPVGWRFDSGSVINLAETPRVSIQAYIRNAEAGSVKLVLSRSGKILKTQIENVAPYALNGDINWDYVPYPFTVGDDYHLVATTYTKAWAGGKASHTSAIDFSVVNDAGKASTKIQPTAHVEENTLITVQRIYPNPSLEREITLGLSGSLQGEFNFTLTDLRGRVLYEGKKIAPSPTQVLVLDLPSPIKVQGVFLLNVYHKQLAPAVLRIFKD